MALPALLAVLGVIVGGRLGYVFFYEPAYFLQHPAEIIAVWHGGMAFHGGFIGVCLVLWIFARKEKIDLRTPGNIVAIRPMKDGVIADFEVVGVVLRCFVRGVCWCWVLVWFWVVVCVVCFWLRCLLGWF
jgi:hypothetical protein